MLTNLVIPILGLPRITKRILVLLVDASLCVLTIWIGYYLRMGYWVSLRGDDYSQPIIAVGISLVLALPIFIASGLYRAIFRYSGWSALMAVVKACLLYGMIFATTIMTVGFVGVPRTLGLIQPMLLLITIALSRVVASYWLGSSYRRELRKGLRPQVFIYGAGSAGRQLAAALRNSQQMKVAGFLDDAPQLWGQTLNGIAIYKPSDLNHLAPSLGISDVLLALPSISRERRNQILSTIALAKVGVRTLPSFTDLASGKIVASDIRELDVEDLLGRESVAPDENLLRKNILDQVVLVTGAGGSIGSELCRQILQQHPQKLVLLEQSEFALYSIVQELRLKLVESEFQDAIIIPILASVRDEKILEDVFIQFHPHIVFHAAAYKHVPLVESNPTQGVLNNAIGTYVLAKTAVKIQIPNVVLISTDKAVRPTNVMGASKRLAEMILQAFAANPEYSKNTTFSMVRFGNVLDSSGSVVPLFRKQIQDGGPITLTHLEVTRYFMTIPEAAQLVIQAGALAQGGDVFLLDMGEPIKIAQLARHMIELSGLEIKDEQNPDGDIAIEVTGLRPGEKLYEELLIAGKPQRTAHTRILKSNDEFLAWDELSKKIESIEAFANNNEQENIKKLLQMLVKGYTPEKSSVSQGNL